MDELNSFIIKFKHLWRSGQDAHLDVECHAGKAWVDICVQLGHEAGLQIPKNINKNTPSIQHHRARRAAARGEQDLHAEEVVGQEHMRLVNLIRMKLQKLVIVGKLWKLFL